MFLASNCTCAVYFTYTVHVQLLAKNMAATHVHAICIRNQTNTYAFVLKIILCMYLLYALGLISIFLYVGRIQISSGRQPTRLLFKFPYRKNHLCHWKGNKKLHITYYFGHFDFLSFC